MSWYDELCDKSLTISSSKVSLAAAFIQFSFIFTLAVTLPSVSGAAVLGGFEIPRGEQQSQMALLSTCSISLLRLRSLVNTNPRYST